MFNLTDKGGKKFITNIVDLFDNSRGSDMAGSISWKTYNAPNAHLNCFWGKAQDNTASILWFGDNTQVKRKVLDVEMETVV